MKITKKILENLIKEELNKKLQEQGLGGIMTGAKFAQRKRDAAQAKKDREKAVKTDIAKHHQILARLEKRVAALEAVVKNIEMNAAAAAE